MGLSRSLLRGISAFGFERPSKVQARAIVPLASGRDAIVQAPSGMGKTGAFAIALLQRVDPALRACQALVVSPTRELSSQTEGVVQRLGAHLLPPRSIGLFAGGVPAGDDYRRVARSPPLVAIGTPGRLHHLVTTRRLHAGSVRVVVLDEADALLLSEGFGEQLREIFSYVPRDVQVVLASATLPAALLAQTPKFLRNPLDLSCEPAGLALPALAQYYVDIGDVGHGALELKLDVLADLYPRLTAAQTLVFASSCRTVDAVRERLNAEGCATSAIHASSDSAERAAALQALRDGSTRMVVASDVLARGVDAQHVRYVVNVDLPSVDRSDAAETFLHRCGRCARYGRAGTAITLVTSRELVRLRKLAASFGFTVSELPDAFDA